MFRRKEEVTQELTTFHNEEFHNLKHLPNIIRVMKSRWAGHVTGTGRMRTS